MTFWIIQHRDLTFCIFLRRFWVILWLIVSWLIDIGNLRRFYLLEHREDLEYLFDISSLVDLNSVFCSFYGGAPESFAFSFPALLSPSFFGLSSVYLTNNGLLSIWNVKIGRIWIWPSLRMDILLCVFFSFKHHILLVSSNNLIFFCFGQDL